MTRTLLAILAVLLASGIPVMAEEPQRDILGVHLKMTKEETVKRLKEIGSFERDERKRQEIWKVRDDRFSHLIVGFDADEKLRFVTAVAREDKEAKRVPYSDIGDLKQARQAGDPKIKNFHYQWELTAQDGGPQTEISVRGRDEKFLSTYSLKRVGSDPGGTATASPASAKTKAADIKQ